MSLTLLGLAFEYSVKMDHKVVVHGQSQSQESAQVEGVALDTPSLPDEADAHSEGSDNWEIVVEESTDPDAIRDYLDSMDITAYAHDLAAKIPTLEHIFITFDFNWGRTRKQPLCLQVLRGNGGSIAFRELTREEEFELSLRHF